MKEAARHFIKWILDWFNFFLKKFLFVWWFVLFWAVMSLRCYVCIFSNCGPRASHCGGFSMWNMGPVVHRLRELWCTGLVVLRHVLPPWIRDWNGALQGTFLTTGPHGKSLFLKKLIFYSSIVELQCCVNYHCTTEWLSCTYTHTHTHTRTHIYIHSFPCSLPIIYLEYSSLCCTIRLCCLSIICIPVYIC